MGKLEAIKKLLFFVVSLESATNYFPPKFPIQYYPLNRKLFLFSFPVHPPLSVQQTESNNMDQQEQQQEDSPRKILTGWLNFLK